jgi:RNA polymerase sigma-70 factor (ECF subfamily)
MKEEQALVQRVIAGDPEAEEIFFRTFRPRLLRASRYFLGSYDPEAEDIVQEAFIIALPRLPNYVFNAPIYAWLRQICLRLCFSRRRKRGRMVASPEEELELHLHQASLKRLENDELEALKAQRLELLRRLTPGLKGLSREILELRNFKGLSYAEISSSLGIPKGTVMSRLSRAREQMRDLVTHEALRT